MGDRQKSCKLESCLIDSTLVHLYFSFWWCVAKKNSAYSKKAHPSVCGIAWKARKSKDRKWRTISRIYPHFTDSIRVCFFLTKILERLFVFRSLQSSRVYVSIVHCLVHLRYLIQCTVQRSRCNCTQSCRRYWKMSGPNWGFIVWDGTRLLVKYFRLTMILQRFLGMQKNAFSNSIQSNNVRMIRVFFPDIRLQSLGSPQNRFLTRLWI